MPIRLFIISSKVFIKKTQNMPPKQRRIFIYNLRNPTHYFELFLVKIPVLTFRSPIMF